MSELKEAMAHILATKQYRELVDAYARKKYHEKFDDDKLQHGAWRSYDGFSVKDENTIKVKFTYGGGDMDFYDSFEVKIEEQN